ncbi:beta-ketoacyl synthase N-terminal-like domain-containing protein [Nonomuraea sp. NPDC050786]|uniref:beta-ketoacyl synthase N-terminal-like domain-containing protein n=1 Tax=Nonomuraea sp. NPDC050786 TaxID=3154840 RepID=UPI00340096BA
MSPSTSRIFVTGMGVIAPSGLGLDAFWRTLCGAEPRFTELSAHYDGMRPGTLGGRVPATTAEAARARTWRAGVPFAGTASAYAVSCALDALADAGLAPGDPLLSSAMVCVGTSDGQADQFEAVVAGTEDTKDARISSYSVAEAVALAARTSGPAFVVQNTCASANVALSCGLDMIQAGVCDVAVVGGADAYSMKNIIGFNSIQAIGPEPCRPFSAGRRFVTPSEGAGILVLQSERSLREGVAPWAELLSVAVGNDASHPTALNPVGVAACHEAALAQAGIRPEDIDVIYAHGTGSVINDEVEGKLFASRYPQAAVTAIKGTVGHLMGAAGAAGAVASCLTLRHGLVPPTVTDADHVEFGMDIVTGAARAADVRHVQNNAFGFGGNNAISIFRAVRP